MKKFVILSFLILIGAYSSAAWGDKTETIGNVVWTIDSNGTITNYSFLPGFNGNVTIPNTVGNDSVVSVANNLFLYNSTIKSIDFSQALALTAISKGFCQSATNLDSVNFGFAITSIGDNAFYGCSKLKSAILPNTVTSIGSVAFKSCTQLKTIRIPNAIDLGIYNNTYLFNNVFNGVSGVTIIWSDRNVPDNMFQNNSTIKKFVSENKTATYSIGASAFYNCTSLETADISPEITSIGDLAFKSCKYLKEITIPKITSFNPNCFVECENIETINWYANIDYPTVAFPSNKINTVIFKNTETIQISPSAFARKTQLTTVVYGPISSIGNYAFDGCSMLQSGELPEGLNTIGLVAFRNCSNLKKLIIPSSLDNNSDIDATAFTGASFEEIVWRSPIPLFSFSGQSRLKKVTIDNDAITEIPSNTFYNCSNLMEVDLGSHITSIGESAFRSTKISEIVIPNSVTNIGQYAFRNCKSLSSVTFESINSPTFGSFPFNDGSTSITRTYFIPCNSYNNYINAYNTPCNANNTVERCDNVIINVDKQLTHSIEADNVSIERNIYNYPRITVGNYSLDAASMDIEWSFDAKHFYYFTLPFDCNINDIIIDNQNIANKYITDWSQALSDPDYNNGGWQILKYNEPSYANGNSGQLAYDAVNMNYTIEAGVGYVFALLNPINSSASFSIKATFPNNDGYKFSGNNTTSAPSSFTNSAVVGKRGWNLYGNPYYWDIPISNYGTQAGGWVVKPATSSEAAQVEHRLSSESLNPSEVVYIQTTNANGITISANPTTTARVPSRYSTQRPIRLNLLHNNKTDDYLYIQNNTEASDSYIIGEDCYKMKNVGKNQIYTMIDGAVETTFNSMNLEGSVHTIPVGLTIENSGTFQISVTEGTNFMPGTILKLRDTENGAEYNLLNGAATITVGKGTINNRYVIEVMDIPCSEEQISEAVNFTAFVSDGKLVVAGIAANDIVKVYDAMGRMITSLTASADIMNIDLGVRGVYFVNVNGKTIKVVY